MPSVPDGEAAKTSGVAADLWALLGRRGFTRTDVVVGVGGGATTDLAGFVAATWLRGVAVVQVPTTLLGMVDAAVGGKTGINTAEGKNLVGAFHPPAGVLCDLAALRTLPAGGAGRAGWPRWSRPASSPTRGSSTWSRPTPVAAHGPGRRRCCASWWSARCASRPVSSPSDLRESGDREVLNYGHTLGHAIEKVERFRWRHGEAVSVGLVYAAELAAAVGRLARRRRRSGTAQCSSAVGLPTTYDGPWPELLDAMRVDKKARGDGAALRRAGRHRPARPAGGSRRRPAGRGVREDQTVTASTTRRVLVLNGPNLGRLGSREPEVYGTATYDDLVAACREAAAELGLEVEVRQTDDESELVGWLHEAADSGARWCSTRRPSRTTRTPCATPARR